MSDQHHNNEVSLTASYYQLFRKQQPPSNATGTSSAENTSAAAGFWEEDDWTPEEEAEAERLLLKSRERCSIRGNGLAGSLSQQDNMKDDEQAWNKFYSSHQTNFFNDRHYLHKAFPDEFCATVAGDEAGENNARKRTLVEIGCGVGNALLPFLEDSNNEDTKNDSALLLEWTVHGLDLSKVAIEWMRQDTRFIRAAKEDRAMAYVCDISTLPSAPSSSADTPDLLTISEGCRGVGDVSTLLFCLSAIAPGPGMIQAVKNAAATLKSKTGVLVFRDYGRFDEAQMKLGTSRNKQLDDVNFYRKHDGTKCYYFSLDDARELFEKHAGLKVLELKYLRRVYRNRGTNEVRRRVWVQGRFQQR